MKKFLVFTIVFSFSLTLSNSQSSISGFSPNMGQWKPTAKYMAHLQGLNFWIEKDGFTFDNFVQSKVQTETESPFTRQNQSDVKLRRSGQIIKLKFQNSLIKCTKIEALNPISGVSYFHGKDKSKWKNTNTFSSLKISELYKNIDAIVTIDGDQPRYDFVLKQSANPDQIKFRFVGQDKITINSTAEKIELSTKFGKITTEKIFAYQVIDGKTIQVPCRFVLNKNVVTFKADKYDKQHDLIIDPKIYATYLGGSGDEEINSSVIDKDNNLIVTGWTNSNDFPATAGAYDTMYVSEKDIFVTKYQLTGKEKKLLFSTYIGGTLDDIANAVGVDFNGNIYIGGETNSSNFPTQSSISSQINGKRDAFITKLSPDGSKLIYSSYLGGENDDYILALGVGESGSLYVTGGSSSASFPNSVVYNIDGNKGREEAFITKISPSGSSVVYSVLMTTAGLDRGTAIAVDESQATVIACGITDNSRFYTTPNSGSNRVWDRYFNGGWDGFIAKIGTSGAFCEFAGFFGGAKDEYINSVMLDKDGSFYIAGQTNSNIASVNPTSESTDFPLSSSAIDNKYSGGWDAFIAKFDKRCNSLLFSTYYGGNNDDVFLSLVKDSPRNSVFVTGYTASTDFPIVNDPVKPKFGGGKDIVFCEFSAQGTDINLSTIMGGASDDVAKSICSDDYGDYYLSGYTASKNFPANKGGIQEAHGGGTKDGFVLKYTFKELSITTPVKGDEYCVGSKNKIIWSSNNFTESAPKFTLEYSSDGGSNWNNIASDVTGTEYEWKVPQYQTPGNNYLVRIYHASGMISTNNGAFIINSSPSIQSFESSPSNLNLCEGESVQLTVHALGKDLKYAWRKNTQNIQNANDTVLFIPSVSLTDAGKYDVRVSGKCLPDTISGTFNISVIAKPKIIADVADQTIKAGKEVSFQVTAIGLNLSYEWQKNRNKITGASDSIFTITKSRIEDEGLYRCIVTGTCGSDTGREAVLIVDTLNSVLESFDNDNLNPIILSTSDNKLVFTVKSSDDCNGKISVYNNNGNIINVIHQGLINKSSNQFEFDYSLTPSGLYWIVTECIGIKNAKKIILIH